MKAQFEMMKKINKAAWQVAAASGKTGAEKKEVAYEEMRRLWSEVKKEVAHEVSSIQSQIDELESQKNSIKEKIYLSFNFSSKEEEKVEEENQPSLFEEKESEVEIQVQEEVEVEEEKIVTVSQSKKWMKPSSLHFLKNEDGSKMSDEDFLNRFIFPSFGDIEIENKKIGFLRFKCSISQMEKIKYSSFHIGEDGFFPSKSINKKMNLSQFLGLEFFIPESKKPLPIFDGDIKTTGKYNFSKLDEEGISHKSLKDFLYKEGIKMKWDDFKKEFEMVGSVEKFRDLEYYGVWIGELMDIDIISSRRDEL